MQTSAEHAGMEEVSAVLEDLIAAEPVRSDCLLQLALMVARIAVEPCAETYKEEAAHTLMALIRAKPKSNVIRLFARP